MISCRRTPLSSPMLPTQVAVKDTESPRQVHVQLASISAYDIQENLNLKDELWVEYNVVAIKEGKILRMESASRFLGGIQQGGKITLDSIPALRILLNPGEQLGVQVSLWELDDYSKDQHLLKQVNQWGGMLQIPMMLVEWSSVSNPVSWFLWGARLGSIGLDYWSKQDGRDLLGVSELQWEWSEIKKGKLTRFKRGNWKGGRAGFNAYQYGYAYRVHVNE
ncbi:MAG: hypothetical protein RLZZ474_1689 [Bacteroidota bacterium]